MDSFLLNSVSKGKKKKSKLHNDSQLFPSTSLFNVTDVNNGLYLKNKYMPDEIVLHILSFVEPKQLLKCCLVCHKWNKFIKSITLWSMIYTRKYNEKVKILPWYLYCCLLTTDYFDTNLLVNGNGQDGLKNWECKVWEGDRHVERFPTSAERLPQNVPEFNGYTSCFATTYFSGHKLQLIKLGKNKLFRYILDNYKPHIYVSEWTTGIVDCGCVYKLQCGFIGRKLKNIPIIKPYVTYHKAQWEKGIWEKMELLITEYPEGIEGITFENEGQSTQSWKKHYGSKMAGGVVKFLFDSLEPLSVDDYGNVKSKVYSKIQYTANGLPQEQGIDYLSERYLWQDEDNEEQFFFMLPN